MLTIASKTARIFGAIAASFCLLMPAAQATIITTTSGLTTTYSENFNGGSSFSAGWVDTLFNNDDYMWLTVLNPSSSFSFTSSRPLSELSLSFWYSVPGGNSGEVEFANSGVVSLADTPGNALAFTFNNPGPSNGGLAGGFDSQFLGSVYDLGAGMYTITLSTAGGLLDGVKVDDLVITTNAVPEPASLAIFGLGLLGLGVAKKRSASKKHDRKYLPFGHQLAA